MAREYPQVAGERAADRLMRSLDYRLYPRLARRLTRAEVAIVLHALADHTALEAARTYSRGHSTGQDAEDTLWPTTLSIGRWLHDTTDQLEDMAEVATS